MLINLFDSNFTQSACSTAYQESQYIQYVRDQMAFDGVTLFTDEWINNPIVDQVQSRYKVGWLHEPYCLHIPTYERAEANFGKFDLILTYHQPFLDKYPDKCKLVVYAGTWIDRRDWGIKPKSRLCSMLIGSKMATEGHRIRHNISEMIETNGYQVDFYGARGTPVGYGQETKYTILKDYCFSLAIETCREENLFSEWIVDCFALGTIPIFWGAPNIHEFFDTKGVLQFDTVDRLQKILAGLSTNLYAERLLNAFTNLHKVESYSVTEDWVYEHVLKEFE